MERSPEEIVAFQRVLDELMDESYRADLWGAAYVINGGCSDDGFEDFPHSGSSRSPAERSTKRPSPTPGFPVPPDRRR